MLYKTIQPVDLITKIVTEAESWLGTPYHHQAKLKGVGVDCCNLILAIAENCDIVEPIELEPYSLQWHLHSRSEMMLSLLERYNCTKLEVDLDDPTDWTPGSILCLKYGRACSHLALVLPELNILHAAIDFGKVVKQPISEQIVDRAKALYTYPEKI